ncbi:MAG: FecR domain-containing protein [Steroidobacteraceae bacterium]
MIHTQVLEEAAEWFVTMRDGADEAERAQFADWLRRSPEHVRAYLELTSVWADAAGVDAERRQDADALLAQALSGAEIVSLTGVTSASTTATGERSTSLASGRAQRKSGGWLAAAAAMLVIVGTAWWQLQRPTYVTDIGEQRSLVLADGSRVQLNSRSRLRVRFSEHERSVDLLEGQGLFEVAKDAGRPFIVYGSGTLVRAVGTQFDVNRRVDQTVVTVLEGKVQVRAVPDRFSSAQGPATSVEATTSGAAPAGEPTRVAELAAGEQAVVAADQITLPDTPNIAAATAWTQRQLIFESARLADVVFEFNRNNERQLVIRDVDSGNFLVSGVFSSTDPAPLLSFLEQQADFHVQTGKSEIHIWRGTARN